MISKKLNTIKILVSKSLIDWYIYHDEFVPENNVLREYNEMEEEIKILKMLYNASYNKTYCVSSKKNTANKIRVSEELNKIF